MRACPYCAEQIQNAAIVCRFCGRDVTPVTENAQPKARNADLGVPSQQWYEVDQRIRTRAPASEPKRTIWSKLGGALEMLGPSRLRPNRTGRRQSMVWEYRNLRDYQVDVARLTKAGWAIERQSESDDPMKITVTWIREPATTNVPRPEPDER